MAIAPDGKETITAPCSDRWELLDETDRNYPAVVTQFGSVAISMGRDAEDRARIARLIAAAPDLLEALKRAEELCQIALPQFDWGKSALDADGIRLLNEVPQEIRAAIKMASTP